MNTASSMLIPTCPSALTINTFPLPCPASAPHPPRRKEGTGPLLGLRGLRGRGVRAGANAGPGGGGGTPASRLPLLHSLHLPC